MAFKMEDEVYKLQNEVISFELIKQIFTTESFDKLNLSDWHLYDAKSNQYGSISNYMRGRPNWLEAFNLMLEVEDVDRLTNNALDEVNGFYPFGFIQDASGKKVPVELNNTWQTLIDKGLDIRAALFIMYDHSITYLHALHNIEIPDNYNGAERIHDPYTFDDMLNDINEKNYSECYYDFMTESTSVLERIIWRNGTRHIPLIRVVTASEIDKQTEPTISINDIDELGDPAFMRKVQSAILDKQNDTIVLQQGNEYYTGSVNLMLNRKFPEPFDISLNDIVGVITNAMHASTDNYLTQVADLKMKQEQRLEINNSLKP